MAITKTQFDKLTSTVDWSVQQLEKPRQSRLNAIKEYVGIHYADKGADKRVPTNFLELAVGIYARTLAPRAPRIFITANNKQLAVAAYEMELAINQIPDEVGLSDTLHRWVTEAIFSYGILKSGIHTVGNVLGHDYGRAFVDLVTMDDYIVDMSAKSAYDIQFEGNDYWLDLEDVVERYKVSRDKILGDEKDNSYGRERADSISVDNAGRSYRERVKLRDLWLPRDNVIITYVVDSKYKLAEVEWDGPENGPYHKLGFSDVPGNVLPLPPVALWQDLHELANGLFRKMTRQADAQKSVTAFSGGDDEAVRQYQQAKDGDGISFNGQMPETIKSGGVDSPTLAFYLQVRDMFSYLAGNLDSLGGLAPASDTVGQDKLLSDAASSRVKQMSERTTDAIKGVFKALAWYEWTDPVRQRILDKPVPGTDITVQAVWSAETREGDFLDYNFDIDVFSMQDDTPSDKMRKLGVLLQEYIFPLLPTLQQQGVQMDFQKLIAMFARYSNMPELHELLIMGEAIQQPGVQGSSEPTKVAPASTTRRYIRENRPGATRAGKDHVMSQLLMGGNAQPAEKAALFRSAN